MYAVKDDTETKLHIVLYLKLIFLQMGWVNKRPIIQRSGTTDHLSSKRSKQDPRAKRVWVG